MYTCANPLAAAFVWSCRGTVRHEKTDEGAGREKRDIHERNHEFTRGTHYKHG